MCGIVYVKREDAYAQKTVVKRFNKQRSRGLMGFGYITVEKGKVEHLKRFETEKEMIKSIKQETAKEILFHHRTPTSTPNISETNHPILVENNLLEHKYYVIHNGMIGNDLELQSKHADLGFEYTTEMTEDSVYKTKKREIVQTSSVVFNDSEVFAIDLALYLEGLNDKIESMGSIAFICIETDKKDNILKIHYGRNEKNPLVIEEARDMFILKSEGGGTSIKEDVLYSYDYNGKTLIEKEVNIGDNYRFEKKCDYGNESGMRRRAGYSDYDYDHEMEQYYPMEDRSKNESNQELGIIEFVDELYERYQVLEGDKIDRNADINVLKLQISDNNFRDNDEEIYSNELLEELEVEYEDIIDEMTDINSRIQAGEAS